MYDTGTPKPVFCDNVEGWDGVQDAGSRGVQKGGGICTPMANSC